MGSGKPLGVEADALNVLATSPRKLQADTVLTPHPGEAARLLSIKTHEVQADRRPAALALCERFGCVVVLKAAGTLVAAPGRIASITHAGTPGLPVGAIDRTTAARGKSVSLSFNLGVRRCIT